VTATVSIQRLESLPDEPHDLVRELLLRPVPPAELVGRALVSGVPVDQPVRAFRARSLALTISGLGPLLRRQAAHHWISLVDLDGDIGGLTTGAPRVAAHQAVIGLGPEVPLARAHGSFVVASRAVDAAWSTSRVGTYELAAVALSAAAVADHDVGVALDVRYLACLDALGPSGEALAETVRVYLACNLSSADAGDLLGLHRNSVRYRIRRFEELTGTDLECFEDAFRVWWALEWRRRLGRSNNARGLVQPPGVR